MRKLILRYKKIFERLIILEIARGILILQSAFLMTQLINDALMNQFQKSTLGILLVIIILRIVAENLRAKKFNKVSLKIQTEVRKKLHGAIFSQIDNLNSGELLTIIFDTVESLDEMVRKILPSIFSIIILIPMIIMLAIFTDLMSAAIFLLTFPIAPFILYLIGREVSEKNESALKKILKLNGDFREILSSITTLKIFNRTKKGEEKLKNTSEKSSEAVLEILKLAFVSSFALELITTLSIALIAVTIGLRILNGEIKFEEGFIILMIAPEYYEPIRRIGVGFHAAVKAKDAVIKLKKYLSQKSEKTKGEKIQMTKPIEIKLEKVKFAYDKKQEPIFRGINVKIKAGVMTAIKGESGAGKTTLLKIITGLKNFREGEIYLNEVPISKMEREKLYEMISYVEQQPHLFKTSLRENLTVFKNKKSERLKKILKELEIKLEEEKKYEEVSRGQLQRIGLARALIKNAEVIILDEPTAGLDLELEEKILRIIKKYSEGKTVIIATHREKVIKQAEEVIDLEKIKN